MCWFAANVTRSPCFARFDRVGQVADAKQIGASEQRDAVAGRQALAPLDLVGQRQQRGVADQSPVELRGRRHAATPRSA